MRVELGIDVGLEQLAEQLTTSRPDLAKARRALVQRITDLQRAAEEVSATVARLRYLEGVVGLTEEGWSARRTELLDAMASGARSGLDAWLGDYFHAVATGRMEAVERLRSLESSLPDGSDVLARRCRATVEALRSTWWEVAAPLLAAGADGIRGAGDREVPSRPVRHLLELVLVRLALGHDPPMLDQAAERIHDLADAEQLTSTVAALHARLLLRQDCAADAPAAIVDADADDMEVASAAPSSTLPSQRRSRPTRTSMPCSSPRGLRSLPARRSTTWRSRSPGCSPRFRRPSISPRASGRLANDSPTDAVAALERAVDSAGRHHLIAHAYDLMAASTDDAATAADQAYQAGLRWVSAGDYAAELRATRPFCTSSQATWMRWSA